MSGPQVLAFAGTQHEQLRAHLFPGDGLEAAAVLLCGAAAQAATAQATLSIASSKG